ncbi:MAG: hypothetical protein ACRD1K_06595 [Acidimicrobiales bacterium]
MLTRRRPLSDRPILARQVVGRAGWTLASQGLSSASNFVLTGMVLATVEGSAFAVFAICLTTYLLLLQFARYVIGIPVLVPSAAPDRGPDLRGAVGVAAWTGIVASAPLCVVAVLWPPGTSLFLLLAGAAPFLLVQDSLRHVAIAEGRPQVSAAGDAAWVGLQVALSGLVLRSPDASAAAITGAWVTAGAGSAIFLGGWLRVGPAPLSDSRRWLREHAQLCRRVAVEFVVTSGSYYGLCFGLAAVAGAAELGHLRAAQTLFGPASVLLLGGAVLGVPESVRIRGEGRRLVRFALLLSAGLALLALACGAAVYALLPNVGPRFFPDSWAAIRAVIPWLTLFGVSIGAGAGAIAGLRALDASRWVLTGRAVAGAIAVAVGLPASGWLGARGTFAGLGLAETILAVRAWRELCRRAPVGGPGCIGMSTG